MRLKSLGIGKRLAAVGLAGMLAFGAPASAVMADETESGETEAASPANPVHHCTGLNDGTDYTDWSYIYFGSYPQSEVTGDDLTEAIINADYGDTSCGDAWVDGTKYRRVSAEAANNTENFGDSTYRYFKWERIKWRVLQNDGNTLFVMADKALDCRNYNEEYTNITWEDSTLRSWLNSVFYDVAFSNAEQSAIVEQTVVNEDNPEKGTEGGNDTSDKVYLLSISEVTNSDYGFCKEAGSAASRHVSTSAYAYAMGTATENDIGGENDYAYWWLRSPGYRSVDAADVQAPGYASEVGWEVNGGADAVVPVLYIECLSSVWKLTDDGTNGSGGEDGTGEDSGSGDTSETEICSHANTEKRNVVTVTCTTDGYTGDTYCTDCGKKIASGETITALGHSYTSAVTTEPTYTAEGVKTYTCTRCNDIYTESIAKLICAHTSTEVRNATDAACTNDGYTGDTYCTVCGEKIASGETISATGHTLTKTNTVAATCVEAGAEAYYTCSSCGKMFSDEAGTAEINAVPAITALGHDYTSVITTEPTTSATGVRTYTCTRCGDTYTETIDKIPSTEESTETATATYTIKFKANASNATGSTASMKNCEVGASYKLTKNGFKRKGYTFTGWNTKKDGSGKSYKNKASVKNLTKTDGKTVTLYAQWEKVKVGKVSIKSAKNSKAAQLTVKYKKVSGADGYEISYSTNKNFRKSVTKKTTTKTSYTAKKLKKGKTYYVRVRAYKKDSAGKKVYGKYSAVKKVTVKK